MGNLCSANEKADAAQNYNMTASSPNGSNNSVSKASFNLVEETQAKKAGAGKPNAARLKRRSQTKMAVSAEA